MDMSIEDIIFDLYLVAKFKGYRKVIIKEYESLDLSQIEMKELPLPKRSAGAFEKKGLMSVADIVNFVGERNPKKIRNFGERSAADTKGAILEWHIENNIRNGRHPLWGVELSYI